MESASPPCRSCDDRGCVRVGALADMGGLLHLAGAGDLYECPRCGLLFRHPYLDAPELARQYADMPAPTWDYGGRGDFAAVRRAIVRRRRPPARVLDIGCFRGAFLLSLPAGYERLGIEASHEASKVAEAAGVTMAGRTIDEAIERGVSADVVTAIDVLEHVLRPLDFLASAARLVAPGGLVLISTGDPDSWLWRRHRLDYWYYLSEHVVFSRRAWFSWAAERVGLRVQSFTNFSHDRRGAAAVAVAAARTLLHEAVSVARRARGPLRHLPRVYPFSHAARWPRPPTGRWTRDHLLTVLGR